LTEAFTKVLITDFKYLIRFCLV